MMEEPLVTIAIPTYNRADGYLPHALGTALDQTYSNLDIIVADNCSTDGTASLVRSIADPRIRYFRHRQNIGANANFNFCLQEAKGVFFLLLHDDDAIDADFIETCMHSLNADSDIGIIRTGTRLINPEGIITRDLPNQAVGLPTDEFFRGWFAGRIAIYLCSTIFHTQRLRDAGGFQSKYNCYQDAMAIVQLAAKYGRADVSEVKASFRVHAEETGFSKNISDWCEESLALLDSMCRLVPEKRDQIWREGLRFFSTANYHRGSAASSPFKRFVALMKVVKYFKFRHLPSFWLLVNIFYGTRLYSGLRFIKRNLSPSAESTPRN